MLPLTFEELRDANRRRLPQFKNALGEPAHSKPDGSDWSLPEWSNAAAGEIGEACNLAKKIRRGDFGAPGTASYVAACKKFAIEMADAVTYADLSCLQVGLSLGECVREKFNETSRRVGADVFI